MTMIALSPLPAATTQRADRVQIVPLPCGVPIWLVEDRRNPVISVRLSWTGGALQDEPERAGAAVLLGLLLTEGAGPLSSDAFQQRLADQAIDLSFQTDRDVLTARLRTLSSNASEAFALLELAITEARCGAEAMERAKGRILATLGGEASSPRHLADQSFWTVAFPDHPLGRPAKGTADSVAALGRRDLWTVASRILARDTLIVTVAGDITAARVVEEFDRIFSRLPACADRIIVPPARIAGLGRRHRIAIDVPQTAICFGRPGVRVDDEDFLAAQIVDQTLGAGSLTSRLAREIRERRGLCYSVRTSNRQIGRSAVYFGSLSTRNDRVDQALAVAEAELRRMSDFGPSADELAAAKSFLIGSFDLDFDTSSDVARVLTELQQQGKTPDWLDRRAGAIDAVTIEAAARAASRLCGDGSLAIALAGKPGE